MATVSRYELSIQTVTKRIFQILTKFLTMDYAEVFIEVLSRLLSEVR